MKDQNWWRKYTGEDEYTYHQYDPEGYDSYGYDKNDIDRAGNNEFDYAHNDGLYENYNRAYEQAYHEWGFDGVKPVKRV
jgi:hypothetical protein